MGRSEPIIYEASNKIAFGTSRLHQASYGLFETRLILLQQWEQFQANTIPEIRLIKIARVLPELDFPFRSVPLQRGFAQFKQRPHNSDIRIKRGFRARTHPGKAFDSSSSEQTKEKQFRLVTSVVRKRDCFHAPPPGSRSEKFVTQFARGHFDADLVESGVGLHVTPANNNADTQLLGRSHN
jgi:hypothetical protein